MIALICARSLVASGVVEDSDLGDVQLGVRAHAVTLGIWLCSGLVAGAIAAGILRRRRRVFQAPLGWAFWNGAQDASSRSHGAGRVCFVLLTGAVLVIQNLSRMLDERSRDDRERCHSQDEHVAVKYPTVALRAAFANGILARVGRKPGVTSEGLVSDLPLVVKRHS